MQTLSLFFWYVRLRIDVSRYLKCTFQMATFILEVLPGFTGLIFLGHLHGQKYIDAAALGNMVNRNACLVPCCSLVRYAHSS